MAIVNCSIRGEWGRSVPFFAVLRKAVGQTSRRTVVSPRASDTRRGSTSAGYLWVACSLPATHAASCTGGFFKFVVIVGTLGRSKLVLFLGSKTTAS